MCTIPMNMEYCNFAKGFSGREIHGKKHGLKWEIFNHLFRFPLSQRLELWNLLWRNRKTIEECVSPEAASAEEGEFHLAVLSIKVNRNTATGGIHANSSQPTLTYPNKLIILFNFLSNPWAPLHSSSPDCLSNTCLNILIPCLSPPHSLKEQGKTLNHLSFPHLLFFLLFLHQEHRNSWFSSKSFNLLLNFVPTRCHCLILPVFTLIPDFHTLCRLPFSPALLPSGTWTCFQLSPSPLPHHYPFVI